jgi:hypothetical protein
MRVRRPVLLSLAVASAILSALLVGCGSGGSLASSGTSYLVGVWLLALSLIGGLVGCGGGSTNGSIDAGSAAVSSSTTTSTTQTQPTPGPTVAPTPVPTPLVPAKVAFVTPPGTKNNTNAAVQAGTPLPPFTVAIEDVNGTVVTSATHSVTVALGPGSPAGASLSGTLTVNAVNGIATFNNVIVLPAGVNFTLVASAAGLTSDTSPAFGINPLAVAFPGRLDLTEGKGSAAFQYFVQQNPVGIAHGKLTASGQDDLVVANTYANTVAVLLSNGDGTFQAPKNYAAGSRPESIAIADFNHDGHLDLAIGNNNQAAISILLGNGDGTFGARTDVATQVLASSVVAADLGNGEQDLVLVNRQSGPTMVLLGNGDGTFKLNQQILPFSATRAVAVGNVTNSGHPDVIVAQDNQISVLPGNGDGTFQAPVNLGFPGSPVSVIAVGGSIAFTNNANFATVIKGNGDGSFAAPVNHLVPPGPGTIVAADVTGDGVDDLVVTSRIANGEVSILDGNGDGTYAAARNVSASGAAMSVTAADFTSDGNIDLATVDGSTVGTTFVRPRIAAVVSVLVNKGDGTFVQPTTLAPFTNKAKYTVTADVNGDGNPDLLTTETNPPGLAVMLGNADGSFGDPIRTAPSDFTTAPAGLVAADLDGDNIVDVAVAQPAETAVFFLKGNGDGTFQAPINLPRLTFGAEHLVVADIDGDHHPDIVTANFNINFPYTSSNDSFTALLGNGDGTFQSPRNFGVGQPWNLVTGDFNHDGKVDIAAVSQYNNGGVIQNGDSPNPNVSIMLGNGDGTFQAQVNYTVAASPFALGAADLNGDGFVDLAVTGSRTGDVSILLANSDGTFRNGPELQAGLTPQGIAIVDINLDGVPDIVTANNASNDVSVFVGNGDGTFATPRIFGAEMPLTSVVVADFNHDNKPDIVATGRGDTGLSEFFHL